MSRVSLAFAGVLSTLTLAAMASGGQEPPSPAGVELVVPSFGLVMLDIARRDVGLRETTPNAGPGIDEALRMFGAAPPAFWCAAKWSQWLRLAEAQCGHASGIHGSARVLEIKAQLQAAGLFVPVPLHAVAPGDSLLWTREGGGHIGIVEHVLDADNVGTIEANSGTASDAVARMPRRLSDPRLLGAARWRS